MYLVLIYLPLIGSIILGLFSRFLGRDYSILISLICIFSSFFLSLFIFYEVGLSNSVCLIKIQNWFDIGLLNIYWGFLFDSVTCMMLIIITFISSLVHLYSISYMHKDPHLSRFMSYLSLFTVFMLFLVTSDNFVQMFLGWEGVGLSSYLLINFWYTRLQANKAAIKALIINRIGDLGIIIGISLIYILFKSLNFYTVFALTPLYLNEKLLFLNFEINYLSLICFFLFIGAIGKSAQIGLHTWLPDAMEGPTPVSALIHAATMVTAGVFVIIRCSPLMEYSPSILLFITIIGSLTAFFAATTGIFQNDLKKVIAYSTCSQLGYMIFACGLSNYNVSFFHLINHAFFKALLFLSAGSIIHAMSDEQDMRKMGGLINILPFSYIMMFIGSFSLMGFPFLTGFYSKDIILELSYASYSIKGYYSYWLGIISAFFTAFYSFRLLYLTFWINTNSYKKIIERIHESSFYMSFPLFILSFCSIFIGYLFKDMFIGFGTNFWGNSIFILNNNMNFFYSEFLPFYIKLIPIYFSLLGAFFIYYLNYLFFSLNFFKIFLYFKNIYKFLIYKWYFDFIYNKLIINFFLSIGFFTFKNIDRGLIELIGPLGLVRFIYILKKKFKTIQTSYIYNYVFIVIIGITFIISYFFIINFFYFHSYIINKWFLILILIIIFFSTNNKK